MSTEFAITYQPESPLYRPPAHHFRGGLGRFATGVAVVTYDTPDGFHGITVNSFTSVSIEPALILVSIGSFAESHSGLIDRPFSVNILGAEQSKLALHFAGKPQEEPLWVEGRFAPRLAGVLAFFECTPWAQYDGGDHTLFLGEVQRYEYRFGDALGFVNGGFTVIRDRIEGREALL